MKFVLKNAEELIAAGFLIVTTALVVLNIICRYFFNMGMVWSEEVATGCFVWSVFIGAIACFKRRGHVGVDIVVNMLPQAEHCYSDGYHFGSAQCLYVLFVRGLHF